MKVALILPSNLWFCPFAKIYSNILKKWNIEFDYIFWNRDGTENDIGISYNQKPHNGRFSKLVDYICYSNFVKKTLKRGKYDRVIVFTSQVGVFLNSFLKKNFNNKYIFDFRDISIEQSKLFNPAFSQLITNSFANVISSPGFCDYLPAGNYIISHNFDIAQAKQALNPTRDTIPKNTFEILTIGGIRDYSSNKQVIESLCNKPNFSLRFVGKGPSKEGLERLANSLSAMNIKFQGYYEKKDEPNYIKTASLLNIYYPDSVIHKTALSNRFYNSLIYRRPMICTYGQIQGIYAEKYGVGMSIRNTDSLTEQISNWFNNLDYKKYDESCIFLLKQFITDYETFEGMLKDFFQAK